MQMKLSRAAWPAVVVKRNVLLAAAADVLKLVRTSRAFSSLPRRATVSEPSEVPLSVISARVEESAFEAEKATRTVASSPSTMPGASSEKLWVLP